ncbi:MAG TPA: LeuA family protein [Kofleriaceae bacterium]|nr:LeuA family protein [Kofleriaceae bacterium]
MAAERDLFFDWNVAHAAPDRLGEALVLDETLRDGIQSPSVVDPSIDDKLRLVELANDLGIDTMDIGLPGAGKRAASDVATIARHIQTNKLKVRPSCAARTLRQDVQVVIDISQEVGIEIEVLCFIGSSPIRQYAEDWDLPRMLTLSAEAIDLCRRYNLPVAYVTEDTTRSRPEVLTRLFTNAVEHGAHRLAVCDTVGHATPDGIRNLLKFTRNVLDGAGRPEVGIDWHGHNDRGLGVVNSIFAIEFGADRIHGTALGIGERVGNAALDQIMLNLKLLGELPDHNLNKLVEWCHVVSRATHVPIHPQYPLAGSDAFRTATGVHAAAIIKAEKKGDAWLADRVYSGVPAGMFGKEQAIEIGHQSGESNVVYWLKKRGYEPTPALVAAVLGAAKGGDHVLGDDEIAAVIDRTRGSI